MRVVMATLDGRARDLGQTFSRRLARRIEKALRTIKSLGSEIVGITGPPGPQGEYGWMSLQMSPGSGTPPSVLAASPPHAPSRRLRL